MAPRLIVLLFTAIEAGWMAFDGLRALRVGSLVTPAAGPYAGQVGPWSLLVSPLGIEPNGRLMHVVFAVYGLAWLAIGVAFYLRRPWAWHAMLGAAIGSLWFLPFGTLFSLIQIVLLWIWRARFQ
jgi:hypothetical protein